MNTSTALGTHTAESAQNLPLLRFFLGERKLSPTAPLLLVQSLFNLLSFSTLLAYRNCPFALCSFTMPLTNGDIPATTQTQLAAGQDLLDPTTAVHFLENEYNHQDGLDVHTLLDSKTHGGLTYNDFLVLPGYIGTCFQFSVSLRLFVDSLPRLPCLGCRTRYSRYEKNIIENPPAVIPHGHRD